MTRHLEPLPRPDIDAVTHLIERVGRDVVLPKFNALAAHEVERKRSPDDGDDVVTVVDRLAEEQLAEGLTARTPGVPVIGEEATHRQPDLLALLDTDAPAWVVDPIDGTRNFACANDAFGIMVSWVVAGQVRAAWVHLPARGVTLVAEEGRGTRRNGIEVRVPATAGAQPYRGTFSVRFMPPAERERLLARAAGRFQPVSAPGAAAVAYTDVLQGQYDFLTYYRLLPWDHGAPALILTEAGGVVEHLDGQPYSIRSSSQVTVVARSAAIAREVRTWISGAGGLGDR
jgi:fructose-1,6-bisphosphatase/inositol monophosphatase family enzyme